MILHCLNRDVCRHMTRVIRRARNGTLPKAGQDALISTFRHCWKAYRRSMMVFTLTRKQQ